MKNKDWMSQASRIIHFPLYYLETLRLCVLKPEQLYQNLNAPHPIPTLLLPKEFMFFTVLLSELIRYGFDCHFHLLNTGPWLTLVYRISAAVTVYMATVLYFELCKIMMPVIDIVLEKYINIYYYSSLFF